MPRRWREIRDQLRGEQPNIATRQASQLVIDAIAGALPNLLGGSADLTHSNLTRAKAHRPVRRDDFDGSYIHYGVREHGMAAAMNGIALHGGFIPYGGTFLTFADYSRPAIRLAALMGIRVIHVMTHDSIGLGEDGPTHQPVEHLAALRAIPNLLVFRPGRRGRDRGSLGLRVAGARPARRCCACRGRRCRRFADGARRDQLVALGAYVIAEPEGGRDVTLIATGSEVSIALKAAKLLAGDGVRAAVVSAPCFELFRQQSRDYPASVLGRVPRIGVEAAIEGDWARWLGDSGEFVGMTGFGASAPAEALYREFGITAEAVAAAAARCLARSKVAVLALIIDFADLKGTAMARITLRQLLDHAAEHGYGVPAFNINNMEQGAGDHGGGRRGRCARHHPGLARRALLRQRHHADAHDRRARRRSIRRSRSACIRTTATTKPPA